MQVGPPAPNQAPIDVFPTAYIGKIVSLSHSLSQAGGTTAVQFAYCRTHKGLDDEFLGALSEGLISDRKTKKVSDNNVAIDVSKMVKGTYGKEETELYKILLDIVSRHLNVIKKRVATELELLEAGMPQEDIGKLPQVTSVTGQTVFDITNVDTKKYEQEWGGGKSEKVAVSSVPALGKEDQVIIYSGGAEGSKFAGGNVIDSVSFSGGLTILGKNTLVKIGIKETESVATNMTVSSSGKRTTMYEVSFPKIVKVGYSTFKTEKVKPDDNQWRIEHLLQQDWYDPVWSAKNIGEKIYTKLLGCKAIIDDPSLLGFLAMSKKYRDLGMETEFAAMTEAGSEGDPLTIQQAIDGLSVHYGLLKSTGMDVHEFIRTYTHRDIATMPEILGYADPQTGELKDGFHSRAFGDYNTNVNLSNATAGDRAMEGLIGSEGAPREDRMGNKVKDKIPPHIDPRGRARQRVLAYMAELNLSRGLKGA